MIDVIINGQSVRDLLASPPKITDQLNSVCRSLDLTIKKAGDLSNQPGQNIELWYKGEKWFKGRIFKKGINAAGQLTYTAYDPLYYFKKYPSDHYFKNKTATQIFKQLASAIGVTAGAMSNTGAVFPHLYYHNADAEKICLDLIARTYKATGIKYWFRYDPNGGLILYQRKVPAMVWAFETGVNLTDAKRDESIEETATVVKLVNRETNKVVSKVNESALEKYGQMVHFAEVDKDHAKTMEKDAQQLLSDLSKVNTTMAIEGVNPEGKIPQLYSTDVIYVQEPTTNLVGAYHIRNITSTFVSDNLIDLSMDIQVAPDVPVVQYEDAAEAPKETKASKKKKAVSDKGPSEYSEGVADLKKQWGL